MKRPLLALALCLATLTGCATGIGRAVSHAFSGPPESVAQGLDFTETEYLRVSNMILDAAKADTPKTDVGKMRQAAMIRNSTAAQQKYLEAMTALRAYYGVESSGVAEAARDAAARRWDDLLGIAMKHLEGIEFGGTP